MDAFTFPVAFEIWNIYLAKFVKRYGKSKLERSRDLFEQAVEKCPEQFSKAIYLMYAKLEEDFGLAKRAMNVYERACQAVADSDRFEVSESATIARFSLKPVRCTLYTLQRPQRTSVSLPHDRYTSRPSDPYQTRRPLKCV